MIPLLVNLSKDATYDNPLSVLYEVVKTEINHFKIAMITSYKLPRGCFQITGSCDDNQCPIYTAEEMLKGSPKFSKIEGAFIEDWKLQSSPFSVTQNNCPELFEVESKAFDVAQVIPIWIKGTIERWVIIFDQQRQTNQDNKAERDLTKLSLLLNYALTNILRSEQKRQLDYARSWIDEELHEISRLQSLLLPRKDLKIEGTEIAFTFKSYKEAGGDYLDLFPLGQDQNTTNRPNWGGIIADVTGHGPSATVEAAMVDAILRTFPTDQEATPAKAATYLNKHFFTRRDRGKFVTAMLFSYKSDSGILKYVSAGHPNAYVKRGEQVIVLDESKGIPIGVLQDYQWQFKEFKLEPQDILFIYTDVVLETRSLKGEDFGEQRLVETLRSASDNPQQLVEEVEQALLTFNGLNELQDDLTLSAIKIL
ncbi:MAG: PP2C family protein-serine/threonine phosphatase [Enterobacterales bacterium]|nr:PP2C family protein-serine/threonine phosphatase [Enterobacterales bacterium]